LLGTKLAINAGRLADKTTGIAKKPCNKKQANAPMKYVHSKTVKSWALLKISIPLKYECTRRSNVFDPTSFV
tara:strand:+ start:43 stop:258 length:216 start_codon:yes stop_codon:yes gene_type:complete